ncbi:hypothetical protein QL285_059068 [Trifolium repens]|nr:hypothetical protein QL285_059068 [Trifolium repens]
MLEDPKKNQVQVSIEKKNSKIYFTCGWTRLRHLYRLDSGGWVTLLFINPTLFQIKIWQLTGIEKDYPQKNPPHMLMLHQESSECFSNGPVPIFISPKSFMHTLEKSLNPADVGSGVLTLTWNGFCKIALPNENSEITMVDWLGYIWKCHLEIDEHPEKNCKITGEWRNFCRARRLSDGVTVKFGVTDHSNNKVVHLKISPFIGLRTILIAPTTVEGQKPFYQSENYFML